MTLARCLEMVNRADRPAKEYLEKGYVPFKRNLWAVAHAFSSKEPCYPEPLWYEELRAELEIPTTGISCIKSRLSPFFDKGIYR